MRRIAGASQAQSALRRVCFALYFVLQRDPVRIALQSECVASALQQTHHALRPLCCKVLPQAKVALQTVGSFAAKLTQSKIGLLQSVRIAYTLRYIAYANLAHTDSANRDLSANRDESFLFLF